MRKVFLNMMIVKWEVESKDERDSKDSMRR